MGTIFDHLTVAKTNSTAQFGKVRLELERGGTMRHRGKEPDPEGARASVGKQA